MKSKYNRKRFGICSSTKMKDTAMLYFTNTSLYKVFLYWYLYSY